MTQKFELIVKEDVLDKSYPPHQDYYAAWKEGYVTWKERNGIISRDFSIEDIGIYTLNFKDEQSRTNFILSFC